MNTAANHIVSKDPQQNSMTRWHTGSWLQEALSYCKKQLMVSVELPVDTGQLQKVQWNVMVRAVLGQWSWNDSLGELRMAGSRTGTLDLDRAAFDLFRGLAVRAPWNTVQKGSALHEGWAFFRNMSLKAWCAESQVVHGQPGWPKSIFRNLEREFMISGWSAQEDCNNIIKLHSKKVLRNKA